MNHLGSINEPISLWPPHPPSLVAGSTEDLLRVAQEFGLEGLVAKRLDSVCESGRRSGAGVKVKLTRSQEFVIRGCTLPEGSRKYFGSLLVVYQGPDGRLFAGGVGTGSDKILANRYSKFQKLKQPRRVALCSQGSWFCLTSSTPLNDRARQHEEGSHESPDCLDPKADLPDQSLCLTPELHVCSGIYFGQPLIRKL